MTRTKCYRCCWPQQHCWCPSLRPMPTRTRFLFLMHPKEFKRTKLATGRLTHLCLPNSRLLMGVGFDGDERLQQELADPNLRPVLLYPGEDALDLSAVEPAGGGLAGLDDLADRPLLVVLLDATWTLARKMLRESPSLQRLPRVMFTPTAPSRYVIKLQPQQGCLSTLEATHELLLALERRGLDRYADRDQLLAIFDRMQRFQIARASDPGRTGYRLHHARPPAERTAAPSPRLARRRRFLPRPDQGLMS